MTFTSSARELRVFYPLLTLCLLAACGAPGSRSSEHTDDDDDGPDAAAAEPSQGGSGGRGGAAVASGGRGGMAGAFGGAGNGGGAAGSRADSGGQAGGSSVDAGVPVKMDAALNPDASVEPPVSEAEKQKFHLYLMIGGQNMVGVGLVEAQDLQPTPRVQKLGKDMQWLDGTEGTNISRQTRSLGEPGSSMGRAFALELLRNETDPDVKIGLINVAVSGSRIESWQKPALANFDDNYSAMLPYLRKALTQGTLKGVLWHQGESNTGTGPAYAGLLSALIKNLREEVNNPQLPIVLGQIGTKAENIGVNAAMATVAAADVHVGLATSQELTLRDNIHYDTASQRTYGVRYATVYQTLKP